MTLTGEPPPILVVVEDRIVRGLKSASNVLFTRPTVRLTGPNKVRE